MKYRFIHALYIIITYIGFTMSVQAQHVKPIQLETEDGIIWTANRKLKTSDFLGKTKSKASGKALTGANIIIIPYTYNNGKYQYQVLAKFYKKLSWINTDSNYILDHEQLHFDIAELFARKMRQEIHLVKQRSGTVLETDYRRIHKTLFQDYINFQKLYDTETKHSTIKDAQQKWNVLIAKKLESLNAYTLNLL
ncbi:DUF922 domain-containing protein [Formosa sediminum]|uniref:DUF922 domain-containing protein n=1 Tax=Formosa sediminum TaxID=2594004 RepID=A0A516GT60_9FLAO|nr:DUF922 domain-containing protein [Formosa sediminum]QDO94570.1 DUF922 domain-containing protein [Formosa sediminum]